MTATVFGAPEGYDALLLARRRAEHKGALLHVCRDDARMARLAEARSNVPAAGDGARIYRVQVATKQLNLEQVAAHYAISSMFSADSPRDLIISSTFLRSACEVAATRSPCERTLPDTCAT